MPFLTLRDPSVVPYNGVIIKPDKISYVNGKPALNTLILVVLIRLKCAKGAIKIIISRSPTTVGLTLTGVFLQH